MDGIPLSALCGLLVILVGMSAFFSGSETGLMTLNRYRLKHRARQGERSARLAQALLDRPDRLIGLVLLGNVLANSLAASLALVIGYRMGGDAGAAVAPLVLTFLLLIFAEVTPKTLAALYPERVGLPAAYVYTLLKWPLFPVVWLVNLIGNGLLRLIGVTREDAAQHSLSAEELRSVVAEAGAMIPQRHQRMLLSILDLERATVEDIMVPRNEILGIDISEPWEQVLERIVGSSHTRLPVFEGSIDDLKGVVHLRKLVRDPYFIPEGTPLNQQLLNFQDQKRRIGFVVDEYGDIQGLVTLEDILEEEVGEFTSDPATRIKNVYLDADGSVLVHGSVTVRSLNRSLGWKLPTGGPKTLNGLVLEKLQELPKPGKRLEISNYQIEITDTRANAVKTARIRPMAAALAG